MSARRTCPWAGGLIVRPGPAPVGLDGWQAVTVDAARALLDQDWPPGVYRLLATGPLVPGDDEAGTLMVVAPLGPIPSGATVVAALTLGHTLGARLTGITADDLPDDTDEAMAAVIAHVAAAQGLPVEPTLAVHLLAPVIDIPISERDGCLVWVNLDPDTGQEQGVAGRVLAEDAIVPFPTNVDRLLAVLRDPRHGMFAA